MSGARLGIVLLGLAICCVALSAPLFVSIPATAIAVYLIDQKS